MCSGIYKIVNIINGKFYIGSTKNIKERCAKHFSRLKNNSHHSVKFQNDYDIYGRDAFVCEVIEEIPYELLHHITDRITNEVPGINRVLLDLTPKPIGTIEWE